MEFTEKLFKRHRIYTGRTVHFSADEIRLPDGKVAVREYLEHPGAVAILPFVDRNNIVMVRQYRYPVSALTYEIPAGKLDPGERPAACVRRELREETGYRAKTITKLLSYWPTPAFATELLHIYHATDLVAAQKSPDEDEFIDHVIVPFKTALEWIVTGRIKDSKTIIALQYWALKGRNSR